MEQLIRFSTIYFRITKSPSNNFAVSKDKISCRYWDTSGKLISKKMKSFSSCLVLLILLKTCMAVILRLQCGIFADFSIILDELADPQSPLKSFAGKTKRECTLECCSEQNCKSVNYKQSGGNCELIGRNLSVTVNQLVSRAGWVYMTTDEEAMNVSVTSDRI